MNKLDRYADLILRGGLSLRPGDIVYIRSPLETADVARTLQLKAYEAGCAEVHISYVDDLATRNDYIHKSIEDLQTVPQWKIDERMYYANRSACMISIAAQDPDLLAGVDPAKVAVASKAGSEAMVAYYKRIMGNENRWVVVSVPTRNWARKVFPGKSEDEAMDALWEAIYTACHVNADDPVSDWAAHSGGLTRRAERLNAENFASVRIQSGNGTDLTLGLVDKPFWAGGGSESTEGIAFSPNIPTEEVFCAPHKDRVNGVVKSTKPLNYNGVLIDQFELTFKDGAVTDFHAQAGYDALKNLIETDAGSRRLGEVALVPFDSPINRTGLVFYNTLFDENASCHLALGRGYPECTLAEHDEASLLAAGVNDSLVHEDFMVGDRDTRITGIRADGSEMVFFDNGAWLI